jgi:hypothetical protein
MVRWVKNSHKKEISQTILIFGPDNKVAQKKLSEKIIHDIMSQELAHDTS